MESHTGCFQFLVWLLLFSLSHSCGAVRRHCDLTKATLTKEAFHWGLAHSFKEPWSSPQEAERHGAAAVTEGFASFLIHR